MVSKVAEPSTHRDKKLNRLKTNPKQAWIEPAAVIGRPTK